MPDHFTNLHSSFDALSIERAMKVSKEQLVLEAVELEQPTKDTSFLKVQEMTCEQEFQIRTQAVCLVVITADQAQIHVPDFMRRIYTEAMATMRESSEAGATMNMLAIAPPLPTRGAEPGSPSSPKWRDEI